jgi:hypothetical protein
MHCGKVKYQKNYSNKCIFWHLLMVYYGIVSYFLIQAFPNVASVDFSWRNNLSSQSIRNGFYL